MCFHASRFDARSSEEGALILYDRQDESKWDQALISRGMHFLGHSARGDELSSYHLEARIAGWHCNKEDTPEKWREILHLYDLLLEVNYSPSVAQNRIYDLYNVSGEEVALEAAEKLNWENNHFYFLLLGELYAGVDEVRAKMNFSAGFFAGKDADGKRRYTGEDGTA